MEDKLKESAYLRRGKKTTLQDSILNKVNKSMDKKRDIKIRELYFSAMQSVGNSSLSKTLTQKTFLSLRNKMTEAYELDLSDEQIFSLLSPYSHFNIIKNMDKGVTDEHTDFLMDIICQRLYGKKLKKGEYNLQAIKNEIHRI